jgi:4-amino-4-deoxy-L-arabinose transferase-like glycosyltransferase
LRRPRPEVADELDVPSGPRLAALVAVAGLALVLMTIPVIVAGPAIGHSTLIQGARSWVQDASGWLAYLAYARLFLFLPLAAVVARVEEDA